VPRSPAGLLLSAAHVLTFKGNALLTNATGFFFEPDRRLFLVTLPLTGEIVVGDNR
jgi:hypothetical protein